MNIARFACSTCGLLQEERGLCPSHDVPLLDLHDSADRAELPALAKFKGAISPVGHNLSGWLAEHWIIVGVLALLGVVSSTLSSGVLIGVEVLYYLVPWSLLLLSYFVVSPRQRHARRLRRALRAVPAPAALIEDQARVDRETAALGSELMPSSDEGPPPRTQKLTRERSERRRDERQARSRHKAMGMWSMIR